MLLKTLTLTNIRAFNHAEITFQPGMNLIVGINGVGKSTILDSLRILLSQALPKLSQSRSKAHQFQDSDITVNQLNFHARLTFDIAEIECIALVSHRKIPSNTDPDSIGLIFDRKIVSPMDPEVIAELKSAAQQPLALYFSTRRSLPENTKSPKPSPGLAAAFKDSLTHRGLRLPEFADWFFAQEQLVLENAPNAESHLNVLKVAVKLFMEDCAYVRVRRKTLDKDRNGKETRKVQATFLIEKSGVELDISQLSDGERGILALVIDLARRLSIANPSLDDPLQAQAVVLIDELDLHLHPQWQRSIVSKLTTTFPNCQFIATTHSPLIIGEVAPDNIILLRQEEGRVNVIQQSNLEGFGLDSSWILRQLMDTDSRNPQTQAQIDRIEESLEEGDLDLARQHLEQYKTMIYGQRDDEFIRLEASINNLEALADALDTEEE